MSKKVQENAASQGMPRRVIVKSAAWSLPVLATVGVTPAFAASQPTQPIIAGATSISATRGAKSTQKNVSFSWFFTAIEGVTNVAVSVGGLTDKDTVSTPSGTGGSVTFTLVQGSADTIAVPNFTITVSFTHQREDKQAVFNVTGADVPETQTRDLTVASATSNPVIRL